METKTLIGLDRSHLGQDLIRTAKIIQNRESNEGRLLFSGTTNLFDKVSPIRTIDGSLIGLASR